MAGDGSTIHTARNLETAVNSYRQGGHGHATLLQFGVRATWLRTPAGRTAFTGILRYHVHSAGRPSKCRFSEPNLTFANTACWHLLVGTPLWNLTSQTPRLQKIIHRNDGAEDSCTERDGWCLPKTSDELRNAMTLMIRQTIRSKRPGESPSG